MYLQTQVTDPTSSKLLSPYERRIVLLTQAGLSTEAIGRIIERPSSTVADALKRPHVVRYMQVIEATHADDIRPVAKRVQETILESAEEAAKITRVIMNDMFARREEIPAAKLAFATAQDILDRIGASAPKKVDIQADHQHHGMVDAGTLKDIVDVLKEMQ